jgi:hypothetical protein
MHDIAFFCDGSLVWQGPVTNVAENDDKTLSIDMVDKSGRWFRRLAPYEHSYAAAAKTDAAQVFQDIINDLESTSPTGLNLNITNATGVTTERVIQVWDPVEPILNDLADAALDWTVVGLDAYAGGNTVPAGSALVLSTEDHWDLPPQIIRNGDTQVTQVRVVGQGVAAVWPFTVGPPPDDPIFGTIQEVIHHPDANTFSEVLALAKSYFALRQGIQYEISTSRSQLSNRFPYEADQLIPGRVFTIVTNSSCVELALDLRLSRVDVRIEQAHESEATIDLQPFGTGLEA